MRHTRSRHHGIALMVVLAVVGLAALIGFAMLSSASLQAQVSRTASKSAMSEYLAESAVQAAAFYLQNESQMPAAWGTTPGKKIYVTGATLTGFTGSFDIDATATGAADTYQVVTRGHSGGEVVTRTADVKIKTVRATQSLAAGFGGAPTIGTRVVISSAVSNGTPTYSGTGTITGTLRTTPLTTDLVVPTTATINYYGAGATPGTYTMPDGTTGTPQAVSGTIASFPIVSGDNPGSVYYSNGDLIIAAATTVNFSGSLVVKGNLRFQGNATYNFTPQSGMPAVITQNLLTVQGTNTKVNLNGLVWAGGGTSWVAVPHNINSYLKINGGLLVPSGANIGGSLTGTATITHAAGPCDVPGLSSTQQTILGVKYQTYKQ